MNVPSYEEFEKLQAEVARLKGMVNYLLGNELAWFTVQQTMQALNCSRATVYQLIKQGKLTPRYEGKKPLFDVVQVRAHIESTRISSDMTNYRLLQVGHDNRRHVHKNFHDFAS